MSYNPSYSKAWADALLQDIGAPVNAANESFLNAWAQAEGGGGRYNPLNTTQPEPGATNLAGNSAGVKNYTSAAQGAAATVTTITNGLYNGLLAALRSGSSSVADANALAASPWDAGHYGGHAANGYADNTVASILRSGGAAAAPGVYSGSTGGIAQAGFFPTLPGGNWDPFNWPSDLGNTVLGGASGAVGSVAGSIVDGIGGVFKAFAKPLEKYLEDAVLVVFGLIVVIVGLVMLAKAGSGGGAPAAAGGGGGSDDEEGGEGEAAGAGAGGGAELAAAAA